jgi:hypothetical protein
LPKGVVVADTDDGSPDTAAASPELALVRIALNVSPFEATFSVTSLVAPP